MEMCTGQGMPSCPTPTPNIASKPTSDGIENVYFRNAAPYTAELLYVDKDGQEVSHGFLSSGLRRGLPTLHGDVWRARAVRPGHSGDHRLLLEHRIGAIELKDCDCPQPDFVNCNKPPFTGPRVGVIDDPVYFENHASRPIDLYWWNGTCEELISWNDVGGVQPMMRKQVLSTQGHSFRIRAASDGRMLMMHTLNDLVIRGCEEEAEREREAELYALQQEVWTLEGERDSLRESLTAELSRLVAELQATSANATANTTQPVHDAYSVTDAGAAFEHVKPSKAGPARSLLGTLFSKV